VAVEKLFDRRQGSPRERQLARASWGLLAVLLVVLLWSAGGLAVFTTGGLYNAAPRLVAGFYLVLLAVAGVVTIRLARSRIADMLTVYSDRLVVQGRTGALQIPFSALTAVQATIGGGFNRRRAAIRTADWRRRRVIHGASRFDTAGQALYLGLRPRLLLARRDGPPVVLMSQDAGQVYRDLMVAMGRWAAAQGIDVSQVLQGSWSPVAEQELVAVRRGDGTRLGALTYEELIARITRGELRGGDSIAVQADSGGDTRWMTLSTAGGADAQVWTVLHPLQACLLAFVRNRLVYVLAATIAVFDLALACLYLLGYPQLTNFSASIWWNFGAPALVLVPVLVGHLRWGLNLRNRRWTRVPWLRHVVTVLLRVTVAAATLVAAVAVLPTLFANYVSPWLFAVVFPPVTAVAVDADTGRVYVARNFTPAMSVLDGRTGAVLSRIPLGGPLHLQSVDWVALEAGAHRVFVAQSFLGPSRIVTAIPAPGANGGALPSWSVRSIILSEMSGATGGTAMAVNPGGVAIDQRTQRVFVADEDANAVRVLDGETGTLLQTVSPGSSLSTSWTWTIAVDERAGRVFVANSPYASQEAIVAMLDARTGAVLRTTHLGVSTGEATLMAVDEATDHLFIVQPGAATTVHMLDARSGAILDTLALGGQARAAVIDARVHRLFVTTAAGLSIVDARTGVLLGTIPVGRNSGALAVDERADRIVVTADGRAGPLSIVDARTSRVVRRIAVAGSCDEVLVDQRTDRLLLVDQARGVISMFDARSGAVVGTITPS
jgi:DNA-binding beta-propeller fold protein YncE